MTSRSRILTFGLAATLVLAGGVCAAVLNGVVGEVLTIVLISAGLGGGLLLVFFEVGLSEERELAREAERRRKRDKRALDVRPQLRLRGPRRRRR
jgi:hypothetical protein